MPVALAIRENSKTIMRLLLLVALTACLMASCRSTRNIQTAIAKKDTVVAPVVTAPVVPKEDSTAFINDALSKMNGQKIDFKTFSAKVDVDYKGGDGKKYNVNANMRMYKDSVIWISVTAIFGIEGLRAYITKDSVKILNALNSCCGTANSSNSKISPGFKNRYNCVITKRADENRSE